MGKKYKKGFSDGSFVAQEWMKIAILKVKPDEGEELIEKIYNVIEKITFNKEKLDRNLRIYKFRKHYLKKHKRG